MKHIAAKFPAASPGAAGELRDLQQQVDEARSVLADLQRQTAGARRQLDFDDSAYLVEVNEQLIVSALQSQTETEQATQALEELSKSHGLDLLTQLANRVQLQERFAHAIASAHRHRTRMAVLFADIDGFKGINDALGHAAGDDVLKHAANCVARSVRAVDFVCRYGGDEFLVLVTDLSQASDAIVVVRKIESTVASPITVENRTLAVSLSNGVSIYPDDGAEPEVLIRCADVAMYEAKRLKMNSLGPVMPGSHGGA